MKPEIDEEKLLSDLADCVELDEFGQWFNKERARKVLKPLLDDSKQNDAWAAELRKAEENTRQAIEQQQLTNQNYLEAIRQRDEAREQLRMLGASYGVSASG